MKLKSKKSALLLSFTSLLLCFAMLAGSTFAWFTDTATTGVNKIVSGKLKVDIIDTQGNTLQGKTMKWQAKDGREQDKIFWEPGCTYYLEPFRIQNQGNLALKYKIELNGFSGDKKLLEALEFGFYYFSPGFGEARTLGELMDGGNLDNVAEYPGLCTAPIYIFAHMKEEANNDYQELSIDDLSITVYATQLNYENDSFGPDYDKNAQYPDVTYMHATENESLKSAIRDSQSSEKPAYIGLSEGSYQVDSTDVIGTGATLAGKGIDKTTLTASKVSVSKDDVTIKDMTIKGDAPAGNDGAMKIGGKNTVIENVKFVGQGMNGDTKGISVTGENLTIRNSNISNAFRGIIFWDNIGGNNVIEDCTIDNVIYTFNINATTVKPGTTLTVKGSMLNGWTSYAGCMTKVSFEKCNLGKSNGYANLVAYADSDFIDCTFNDGYRVAAGATGKTLTFTNCKLADGTTITAGNFAEKLGDVDADMKGCTVIVNGTTVNWN